MKGFITYLIASIHEVKKELEDISKTIKETCKCKIKSDAWVAIYADNEEN